MFGKDQVLLFAVRSAKIDIMFIRTGQRIQTKSKAEKEMRYLLYEFI